MVIWGLSATSARVPPPPRLAERLGQGFVVDNKPGASGKLGADFVSKAQPNGHTLVITVNTFVITPAL